MLKRVRIEVEEDNVTAAVAWLDTYENAIVRREADRFTVSDAEEFDALADRFGREVTEEVIELGDGGGFWVGRRVVRYKRIDQTQGSEPVRAGG